MARLPGDVYSLLFFYLSFFPEATDLQLIVDEYVTFTWPCFNSQGDNNET